MDALFAPAAALLGRLRYAQKAMVVAAVLFLPLAFVTLGYVNIQRGQVAFSALEREGIAYLRPLQELGARAVDARHRAVTGAAPAGAEVAAAVAAVDAVDRRHGATLETTAAWTAAKEKLSAAGRAAPGQPTLTAYGEALDGLLGLVVRVSDKSNLTLDPDLDTYYIMDALMFRLPVLLDATGRAVDTAAVHAAGPEPARRAAQFDLAVASGAIRGTRDAVATGMETGMANTASAEFRAAGPVVERTLAAVTAVLDEITAAARTGELNRVRPASADRVRTEVAGLAGLLAPLEDRLIAVRIDGFEANAALVIGAGILGVLVVAYLLVGFYRSSTAPLRRMVAALRGLAEGDLTVRVESDTRDEVGDMATGLRAAIDRVRDLLTALRDNARDLTGASAELSAVADGLGGTVTDTSARVAQVRGASTLVGHNVETVTEGTAQMSNAITEISSAVTAAREVADDAVRAAGVSHTSVAHLDRSTAKIEDVVAVISGIANQINLLALNATIEAVRAGAAGRGFAVVADEVKQLSSNAARATEDITGRVRAIQQDTGAAVDAIAHITAVIGRISDIQASITSAVEEQTATTAEMARSVREVAAGSRAISGELDGVAHSATRTAESATVTQQAATRLTRAAQSLDELVGQFRTGPPEDGGRTRG
ncbi:chemotaxis protein [Pilimelia terevasa]|uniref:Chemotaxis protein n=1 Tax=Pilimelia terevasa TaxID=53372 RepID=A0A8J3FKK8_9ACTN|nr:methyl-accepting chemotaxis protein [Pilimelia terevasa]GGK33865.1 chemotaxis protein [Pilimelia terevasa]